MAVGGRVVDIGEEAIELTLIPSEGIGYGEYRAHEFDPIESVSVVIVKLKVADKTELNLAARDTIAKLRDTLNTSLNELLAKAAKVTLSDTSVLGTILHDIVKMYVEADIKG